MRLTHGPKNTQQHQYAKPLDLSYGSYKNDSASINNLREGIKQCVAPQKPKFTKTKRIDESYIAPSFKFNYILLPLNKFFYFKCIHEQLLYILHL